MSKCEFATNRCVRHFKIITPCIESLRTRVGELEEDGKHLLGVMKILREQLSELKEALAKEQEKVRILGVAVKWCEENRQDLLNFISKYKGCFWPKICDDGNHGKCPTCKIYEPEGEPDWEALAKTAPQGEG